MIKIFKPDNVCADKIKIKIINDVIEDVEFIGGCPGSLSGIAALIEGSKVGEVAEKLEGIPCQNQTSCPDQLSKALQKIS
jgi:uncharacterized protein (TIGR03905 family)